MTFASRLINRHLAWRRLLLSSSALVATSLLTPHGVQAQSVIISDARTTEQNLDTLLPPLQPPTAQVTGTGSVIVDSPNSVGVSGTANNWTLTNNGRISGDGTGVSFGLGGTITNTGLINVDVPNPAFSGTGVEISGGFGSITNSGTIAGVIGSGIAIDESGNVTNQSGGLIATDFGDGVHIGGPANFGGPFIPGKAGTVTNDGNIAGGTNGVWLEQGGTVTNTGTISADVGAVVVDHGMGFITNSGTITGNNTVVLNGGGIFTNEVGGLVIDSSQNNAVSIAMTPGTVDNFGRITATIGGGFATGVSINGTITNHATGLIEGVYNGVWMNGSAGTLTNAGTITSVSHEAVEVDPTNSVVNNSGTIMTTSATAGIWMQKAGTITNSGTIGSNGGLSVNFSGNNYANTLILQTGSVLIGNVQAGAGAATDALIFQGTGSETGDKFLNFETLEMNGTDWTLNGTGTFTASSQITSGLLRVSGNLITPTLTVQHDGTLAGGGTVTGAVTAAGIVAPGSSSTTLTIAGSLTMQSNSTLHVDLTPTINSLVNVTGNSATLQGGAIDVTITPGSYTTGSQYTILHADGGVSGTFANDMIGVGSYRFTVSYDPDDVFLTLLRLAFDDPAVCGSRNQCAVGGSLERLGPVIPGDLGHVVDTLAMLDIPGQQRGLASMAGDQHPTLALLALDGHALFGQSVTRRLIDRRNAGQQTAEAGSDGYNVAMLGRHDGLIAANMSSDPTAPDWAGWLRGYGTAGTLSGDINAVGANYFIGGMAAGIDRQFAPGLVAGLSFGYATTHADFEGSDTSGRINSYDIGLYGSYQLDGFHLDAVASYAFLDNKTERQIVVGDISRMARASYHGQRYGLALEGGYDFRFGGFMAQPLLAMQYVHLRQNAFHEDGAGGLDLEGDKSNSDSLRSGVGLRLSTQIALGGVTIAPELRGRWEHEFLDTRAQTDMNFAGQPPAGGFTVVGAKVPRDSGIVGGGLTAMITPWTSAFVDYDYKFNKDQKIHNLTGGVRFEF